MRSRGPRLNKMQSHLHPARTFVTRLDGLVNKLHPTQAVIHRWKIVLLGLQRLAVDVRADGFGHPAVDRGEGFEISFGVTGRNARAVFRGIGEIALSARERLARFAVAIELEVIRILLIPLDRAL